MDAKTLCLGVLTLGEASGYEIKKQVEEGPFAHFHVTSFGAIYPALRRLREEGLVDCREVAQEGRPDKKVYSITEKGMTVFCAALNRQPERDHIRADTYTFLFFGHLIEPRHRRRLFEEYLEGLKRLLADMEAWDMGDASKERRFVHDLGLSYYRMAIDHFEKGRLSLFGDEP